MIRKNAEAKARVRMEQEGLQSKIRSLEIFLASEDFDELSKDQQALLAAQISVMRAYNAILRLRLVGWAD